MGATKMRLDDLIAMIPHALKSVEIPELGEKTSGKVRDIFTLDDERRVLVATDRVSAFDRVLGHIPHRGQVLNQLSLWWFEQLADIVPHHIIASPDVNVSVVRTAQPLPIEMIVRGYITGVTNTSMWTMYAAGDRAPYGVPLPDGLQKNDRLPRPAITPTTKAADGGHDERIMPIEIIERGIVSATVWAQMERVALALFERGQQIADSAGLVLVDTKYEFGLIDGELALIDEVHTPDSSRYWLKESLVDGAEPAHYDKEYLRLWFAARGYRGEGSPPPMPPEFVADVAARYIYVYERLTGRTFEPGAAPFAERIRAHTVRWMNE